MLLRNLCLSISLGPRESCFSAHLSPLARSSCQKDAAGSVQEARAERTGQQHPWSHLLQRPASWLPPGRVLGQRPLPALPLPGGQGAEQRCHRLPLSPPPPRPALSHSCLALPGRVPIGTLSIWHRVCSETHFLRVPHPLFPRIATISKLFSSFSDSKFFMFALSFQMSDTWSQGFWRFSAHY